MAAFREHITFSSLLGIGYGIASCTVLGFTPTQGALAGWLTGIAGMLPDLDSESGRPKRELFSVVAAIAPMFLVHHVLRWLQLPYDAETILLTMILLYIGVRFGLSEVVNRLSVHRGMFHSLPALVIAADIAYLGYPGRTVGSKLLMAGGVAVGFLSHLVLDEVYSVQLSGMAVRLKKSAGSALKLVGPSFMPNIVTFSLCGTLTYAVLTQMGVLDRPTGEPGRVLQQADERAREAERALVPR
ncbi:MAG: metal-dependent hydrolase [Planctomyces sp.]|nr:metal-dependent hydrolase [Planctomyces sp.]